MSEKSLGHNCTLEDDNGNIIYPMTNIDNIIDKTGNRSIVNDSIIWPSEFIINDDHNRIIKVPTTNPTHILFVPKDSYNSDYTYYVNNNQVTIKTNTKDPNVGIDWEIGSPIQGVLIDKILYVPSTKNNTGLYLNNNPVKIENIMNGELLQFKNESFMPYSPNVLSLYTPGQIKGWSFDSYGSDKALFPSGCEASNIRVCVYGNGDLIRGTSVCTSEEYNFSNYTNIVIKYANGDTEFTPVVQIIEDDKSVVLDVPYSNSITSISQDISEYGFKNAKVQISVTASEQDIHEITIFDIKLS